jgi:hypothetical protein
MCEAGAFGGTSFGPSTPGLQQLSQVSGLSWGPKWAPTLTQMLDQLLLQPLPRSSGILLEKTGKGTGGCGGLVSPKALPPPGAT